MKFGFSFYIILAGVILTYSNLVSQIESLIDCWKLGSSDCVLNVLPLNHVHGLIYSLLAPFIVGAQVHLLPKFDAETTWHKLIDQNNSINIITAVLYLICNASINRVLIFLISLLVQKGSNSLRKTSRLLQPEHQI
jgi:acyl-CoA synthetase (AMP-forming)/AMP-acid ligase II